MKRQLVIDLRTAKGMTAIQLAESAQTSESRIYNIERGRHRPRPDEARRWAAVLGVSPEVAFPDMDFPPADASATPPPAPDAIDHPAHYTSHPSGIEPIQITRHESFTRGNAIKYLMRAGRKDPDPRTDLRKARRYIDFELEDLERLVDRPETRGAPGA